jgi:hypothetical protein
MELHSWVEGAEEAGRGRMISGPKDSTSALRSDPPSPGHAIALAIEKGVPSEVGLD